MMMATDPGDHGTDDTMVEFEFPPFNDSTPKKSHEEDIYEDLCYATLRLGPGAESPSSLWPTVPVEKRDYCIKELVETEKNYIEALNMIVRRFMRPLKDVLRPVDRDVIFIHIKELSEIHTGFHSELYKECTTSQNRISNCFNHWKEKFVVYGDYCANLPKSQELIDDLCKSNELVHDAIIRCQMEANKGKFKLRDLLSLPMQRILKYHLLLSELLKHTGETHDDYQGLQKAYASMVDLGQYINEVKRDSETLQIIADIQASITDLDMPENTELKDYGRLQKDGELKIRSHEETKLKNRYVFVFDKVMLMCKSVRGEQYSYKEALILADYQVENVFSSTFLSTTTKYIKDKWSHIFYLVHIQDKTAFTFHAKTEDSKKKWIEAIEKALDNVCPISCRSGLTDHAFTLHSFDKAMVCADCEKLLRGTFFQGYKCTICGIAVHKNCIPNVRSCGAPSLPPRPPLPPSSPSITSNYSGEEDNIRNSWNDLTARKVSGIFKMDIIVRAIESFDGDHSIGQLSFLIDDIITVLGKNGNSESMNDKIWWEGKVQRTGDEGLFPIDLVEEINDGKRVSYEDPCITLLHGFDNNTNSIEGYVNLNLEEYQWYADSMDRDKAQSVLDKLPSGSFLVRKSPKQRGNYVISLNYNGQVKHMRICVTEDRHFYLSQSKYFKSIVELVNWFEENTLAESFNGLHTALIIPYKEVFSTEEPMGYAMAMFNFIGNSTNLLSLRKGDRIVILSKSGEDKGWWKGQIQNKIGYFPLAYTKEVDVSENQNELNH